MAKVEVSLPDDVWAEFERIAEADFMNEEEAIEQLLSEGIRTYNRDFEETEATDMSEEFAEDIWDTAEDPAADRDGGADDDYTF